jgi:hypothetical protein
MTRATKWQKKQLGALAFHFFMIFGALSRDPRVG